MCLFVALLTLIGSAAYIVNDMVIVPYQNELQYTDLNSQYNPDDPEPVPSGYENYEFPEGWPTPSNPCISRIPSSAAG